MLSTDVLVEIYKKAIDSNNEEQATDSDTVVRYKMYKKFIELGKPTLAEAVLNKNSSLKALKEILFDEKIKESPEELFGQKEKMIEEV